MQERDIWRLMELDTNELAGTHTISRQCSCVWGEEIPKVRYIAPTCIDQEGWIRQRTKEDETNKTHCFSLCTKEKRINKIPEQRIDPWQARLLRKTLCCTCHLGLDVNMGQAAFWERQAIGCVEMLRNETEAAVSFFCKSGQSFVPCLGLLFTYHRQEDRMVREVHIICA